MASDFISLEKSFPGKYKPDTKKIKFVDFFRFKDKQKFFKVLSEAALWVSFEMNLAILVGAKLTLAVLLLTNPSFEVIFVRLGSTLKYVQKNISSDFRRKSVSEAGVESQTNYLHTAP